MRQLSSAFSNDRVSVRNRHASADRQRLLRGVFVLGLSLAIAACQGHSSTPQATVPATPSTATTDSIDASAPGAPLSEDTRVGVDACDRYLAQYRRCIEEKIPAAEQPRYRQAYRQGIEALRQAVNATGNTERLAQSCGLAREAAKTTLGKFGCDGF